MTTALQKPACPASPVFLDVHAFSAVLRVSLRGNDIGAVRPPAAQGKLMTVGRNRRFGPDRNGAPTARWNRPRLCARSREPSLSQPGSEASAAHGSVRA